MSLVRILKAISSSGSVLLIRPSTLGRGGRPCSGGRAGPEAETPRTGPCRTPRSCRTWLPGAGWRPPSSRTLRCCCRRGCDEIAAVALPEHSQPLATTFQPAAAFAALLLSWFKRLRKLPNNCCSLLLIFAFRPFQTCCPLVLWFSYKQAALTFHLVQMLSPMFQPAGTCTQHVRTCVSQAPSARTQAAAHLRPGPVLMLQRGNGVTGYAHGSCGPVSRPLPRSQCPTELQPGTM